MAIDGFLTLPEGCCVCEDCDGWTCCCGCVCDTVCAFASNEDCECVGGGIGNFFENMKGWSGRIVCGTVLLPFVLYFDRDPVDGVCRLCLRVTCSAEDERVQCRRIGPGEEIESCQDLFENPWTVDLYGCALGCQELTIRFECNDQVVIPTCPQCGCICDCICFSVHDISNEMCVATGIGCFYDGAWEATIQCPTYGPRMRIRMTVREPVPPVPHCIVCLEGLENIEVVEPYPDGCQIFNCPNVALVWGANVEGRRVIVTAFCKRCDEVGPCNNQECCDRDIPEEINIEYTNNCGSWTGTLTKGDGGCWSGSLDVQCFGADCMTAPTDLTLSFVLCCLQDGAPSCGSFKLFMRCANGEIDPEGVAPFNCSCDPLYMEFGPLRGDQCGFCELGSSITIFE